MMETVVRQDSRIETLKILSTTSLNQLASTFVLTNSIPVLVTSRELGPVNIRKVSEASLFEVVRTLGIEALVLLTIVLSGFEPIFIRLTRSLFAVVKDVMVVPEIITPRVISRTVSVRVTPPVSISKSKWTIYAIGVRTNDHDSAPTALRLGFA